MNPKHSNPTQARVKRDGQEVKARAPYNFVPLPEKVVTVSLKDIPNLDEYTHNSGFIECALKSLSPLFTRCAQSPDFFRNCGGKKTFKEMTESEKEGYSNFFSLREIPVIPGSTLRGMIRNLVEIAGFGKIKWISKEKLPYRAVGDTSSLGKYYRKQMVQSKIKAGYIHGEQNHWFIIPAAQLAGNAFARIMHMHQVTLPRWHNSQNAWKIRVVIPNTDASEEIIVKISSNGRDQKDQEAVLVQTGDIQGKRKDFVFGLPDSTANQIEISNDILNSYRDQITQGQETLLGPGGAMREMQPVFYLYENQTLVFFGHAMMFRIPYPHTPYDLIPPALHNPTHIDIAEAIFGYVQDESQTSARAGRVFFTDAKCDLRTQEVWLSENEITPKILASPKPTTFQHYLVQDANKNHNPDIKAQLAHYAHPTPAETIIRGHKMYWHKGSVDLKSIQETDPNKITNAASQYTRIKPIKTGVTFTFCVYFENLRNWELGAVLWALTLPSDVGIEYRHKVGMGKPLGMGSVQITPTLHLTDRKRRYSQLFEDSEWCRGEISSVQPMDFIKSFENFILERVDPSEKSKTGKLAGIPRIQMLLKMLEWPGPDPKSTSYMTIEPNEYKERPVLPDPLSINQPLTPSSQPPSSGRKSGKSEVSHPRKSDHPQIRGVQKSQQEQRKDAENPYLEAIASILESEHPTTLSTLSIALNRIGKWNEKHYLKLGFKKFNAVVEEVIRKGGFNCTVEGQNIVWKNKSQKPRN